MIHESYEKAALLHGHKCPGLAIGVRAAAEALRILEIDNIQRKDIYCVAESQACYLDGIQSLTGCTVGKGNLIYRPTGKTVFNFFLTDTGESLRLAMKELDFQGDRAAQTEYILTAPFEEIFKQGRPAFPAPERKIKGGSTFCALCGEKAEECFMRVKDGKPVCADCAGE